MSGTPRRDERAAFIVGAAFIWAYLVLRACAVPIVNDEARNYLFLIQTGRFIPFMSKWEACDHVTYNALAWISDRVFGSSPLTLRAPSLLAFLLYSVYVWRIVSQLRSPLVRWSTWPALLAMPLVLEFFALGRGYGLSLAFLLMALVHLSRLTSTTPRIRDLVLGLSALLLSVFASLSFLLIWAMALGITLPRCLGKGLHQDRRWLLCWMLLGVVPWSAAFLFARGLEQRDLLTYGTDQGLVAGTLGSLVLTMFGLTSAWSRSVLFLWGIGVVLFWTFRTGAGKREMTLGSWCALLLAGDVAARVVLHAWRGTPYPEDRTAMHWVVLGAAAFALMMDRIAQWQPRTAVAALPLLLLPITTVLQANISSTRVWPRDQVPDILLRQLAALDRDPVRPITISSHNLVHDSWSLSDQWCGTQLPPTMVERVPDTLCDVLLLDARRYVPPSGYHRLSGTSDDPILTLVRDRPLRRVPVWDTLLAFGPRDEEFIGLMPARLLTDTTTAYVVTFSGTIQETDGACALQLVADLQNERGDHVFYETTSLAMEANDWSNASIRLSRTVPVVPGARRRTVYLHNWVRQRIGVNGRVTVSALVP